MSIRDLYNIKRLKTHYWGPRSRGINEAENLFEKIITTEVPNLVVRSKFAHSRISVNSEQDKNQREREKKKSTYIYPN